MECTARPARQRPACEYVKTEKVQTVSAAAAAGRSRVRAANVKPSAPAPLHRYASTARRYCSRVDTLIWLTSSVYACRLMYTQLADADAGLEMLMGTQDLGA
ncbi:hypothetical protein EVAR_64563_1 [Eumeta japonica]|uniref:Uncharacterized protein n=1 Tax=Eumeta variegata TaxID=151549 RepID=A0A4C1ZDW1_EUMVA|nr:hypothetical protein EVAR_64563_1 [Eumeta japonica]